MSTHDYNTARSLSLREAADPANRAKARAYLEQECCLIALYGFLRMIGETA
jgi:hypothetical protein